MFCVMVVLVLSDVKVGLLARTDIVVYWMSCRLCVVLLSGLSKFVSPSMVCYIGSVASGSRGDA